MSIAKDQSHLSRITALEALRVQLEELLDVATARRIALETEKSALLQAHTETATTLESLSSELDSMRSDIIHERDAHALQIAHLEDVIADRTSSTWLDNDREMDLRTGIEKLQDQLKSTREESDVRATQIVELSSELTASAVKFNDSQNKAASQLKSLLLDHTKEMAILESQRVTALQQLATASSTMALQKEELQLRMDEIVTLKRQFEEIKQSGEAAKNARNQVVRDLESQLQTSTDDLAAMTKLHADLVTSSTAAKLTGDKVIDVLKKQVAENQATSSATIADLTAQLKRSEDELATLVQNHTQALAAARIAADQQLEAATAQSKHDADAVAALRLRIIELETSLTTSNDELSALAAQRSELMVTRAAADAVNKSIVELEARMKAVIAENELAEDDIAKKSKELAAAADLRADLERAITGLQATIQKDGDKIASMSGAVADFQSQLARTENERLALHKKYIELTASSAAADMAAAKAIADWEIQCKTNIAALAVATNQHAELTAAKVAADEQLKAWETQIFSLNKQVTDSTSASAVLEVRNHELETQQSILQADIMDFKQQLGGLIKEQHGWERSVRALEQHISALATAREDQELLAREQVAATNRAVAEVSSMRLQVAEAKTNNEAIKAQVTRRLKS